MPELKLIYFNARGRAEFIRWIFAYGDIPYTDERFEISEWPVKKQTVPGGRVPVLVVDGEPLLQSVAISRYAARLAGLVPSDDLDAARCDALVDTLTETTGEVYNHFFKKSEEEMKKHFLEELLPKFITPVLSRLETQMQGKTWFASGKVTWADLCVGLVVEGLKQFHEEILEEYPGVQGLVDRVLALPKIKQWNDKHPKLHF